MVRRKLLASVPVTDMCTKGLCAKAEPEQNVPVCNIMIPSFIQIWSRQKLV